MLSHDHSVQTKLGRGEDYDVLSKNLFCGSIDTEFFEIQLNKFVFYMHVAQKNFGITEISFVMHSMSYFCNNKNNMRQVNAIRYL